MKRIIVANLFFLISAMPLSAGSIAHGKLSIDEIWARATPSLNGVIYLSIVNHGNRVDRLLSVRTEISKKAELHTHNIINGVMKMTKLLSIEINPGEQILLQPGGHHIMLMGLKRPIKEGEKFPIILAFEDAGEVKLDVLPKSAGAMSFKDKKHQGDKKHSNHNSHKGHGQHSHGHKK